MVKSQRGSGLILGMLLGMAVVGVAIAMFTAANTPPTPPPSPTVVLPQRLNDPQGQEVAPVKNPRFRIERLYLIKDTTARYNTRGVYLITDLKTGQEFFGLSGVGVTELMSESHSCRKAATCTEAVEK